MFNRETGKTVGRCEHTYRAVLKETRTSWETPLVLETSSNPIWWLCGGSKLSIIFFNDLSLMMSSICSVHISLILRGPFTQTETYTGLCSLRQRRALPLFRCFMRSRLPAGYRRLCCRKWETLRNRTARRLRTAEWRKNVAQDRECTVSCDIFSSFCLPESSSRSVAEGLYLPLTASYSALIFTQTLI